MAFTTPDEWDSHYANGKTFRQLGDAERRLLAEHAPAPDQGLALDVGCGMGELARHLSDSGYTVDAVDFAPGALTHAQDQTPTDSAVTYLVHDIDRDGTDGLPHPAYDLITFRLSWAFVHDRTRVMNRLRERLRPGGTLLVITPTTADVPDDRRDIALDEDELGLLCEGWHCAERHDADGLAFIVLRGPAPSQVTCAEKNKPSPHALTGAGVVVTDPAGRILLGWSRRRGVWELPGGKNDPGEDFLTTAARELQEETGLTADPAGIRLLALLMDSTRGIPRMTAAVRITTHTGEPAVTEPHLTIRWEWHEVTDLPSLDQPLFTPSAHVIDTVWPGLLTGLPPVHCYPITPTAIPEPAEQGEKAAELRHSMADQLVRDGYMDVGSTIEAAIRQVPRHRFLPGVALADAYDSQKAPVTRQTLGGKTTSSVSAPWLQAVMLRDAALQPGDTVIEIGSGGYNAALLKEIVGPHGTVITVDIDPYVTDRARRFLDDTGYDQIRVHLGDGEQVPGTLAAPGSVDAVVVTVEARDIPPAWINCLAEGGRLVVPLRIHGYTWSITFTKHDGLLVADRFEVCGFVSLQGPGYRPDHTVKLRGGEITVRFADGTPTDTSRLEAALDKPRTERWTGVTIPGQVPFDKLMLWLATHLDTGFARLAVDKNLDTGLLERPSGSDAATLIRDDSFAYVLYRKISDDGDGLWEFGVHAYGPQADDLADTMAGLVVAWDRTARDHTPVLTIHPAGAGHPAESDQQVITKPCARLTFDWGTSGPATADTASCQPAGKGAA
ncbi:methyltransferase, FxLD system [Streptomyces gibsoniae]|uniref:Protein-L-isoaspartate O-methyltransferase n=1 Tax=Streptomyces gibsoniae TaxID=3075529 RepID=A0ABU2TV07_9ACTN|nr:methyltransferase, FxLD system [Streptomyces sp. DSM 41699]MDT0464796.1 methyltransferase, FxLD system [Streptomyces sp. DSM 41699]